MNCLSDYIGLRGCGASDPPSGLYVNDLPGISLKQMVSLTNEEESTYTQLWSIIQTRAQQRFSLDVREAMGKHYRLKSLLQGVNYKPSGQFIQPIPASSSFVGLSIETEQSGYDYVGSPLTAIQVQELTFQAAADGVYTFYVFDLDTQSTQWLYSTSKSLTTGLNTIQINQTFQCKRIAVVVETGNKTFYFRDIETNLQDSSCCNVKINGIIFSDIDGGYESSSSSWGLGAVFNIVCTWDNLICTNKNLFARAFWYLTGIELLTEQLYSTKLNLFTTVNLQRAKELREEYQVEYMKSLEQIAGGFNLDCDCCVECSGGVQLRESTSFY